MHLFHNEIIPVNEGIGHLIYSAISSNLLTPTPAFLICSALHHQLSCWNFIVGVLLQSAIEVWQKSHLTLLLNIGIKVSRTCSGTYKKIHLFQLPRFPLKLLSKFPSSFCFLSVFSLLTKSSDSSFTILYLFLPVCQKNHGLWLGCQFSCLWCKFFLLASCILSSSEILLTKNLCLTHALTDFTVVLWLSLPFFLPCFMILEFCIVLFPCPL